MRDIPDAAFVPPEYEHAQWARNMKAALVAGQTLRPSDVSWLYSISGCAPAPTSAEKMCNVIIDRWALMQITARLKT